MLLSDLSDRISEGFKRGRGAKRGRVEIEFKPETPTQPVGGAAENRGPLLSESATDFSHPPEEITSLEAKCPELSSDTIIKEDLCIDGNVRAKKKLIIEGSIEGNVDGSVVVVGATGEVKGKINANEVIVRGRVTGEIRGQNVELYNTSLVEGDVIHQGIGIERGTRFDGLLRWDRQSDGANSPDRQRTKTEATVVALKEAAGVSHIPCPTGETPLSSDAENGNLAH